MLIVKNLNQEILKRSQLKQNIEPRETVASEPNGDRVIDNPYLEIIPKIESGEIDLSKPKTNEVGEALKIAKQAVAGMTSGNNTRKAVEALAKAVEAK